MEATVVSLIPPLIVIFLVIMTRRVIISISAGIIANALILCSFQPGNAVEAIIGSAVRIFYSDGSWNSNNILLVLFILGLGMLTAFIDENGGTIGFAGWAQKRVKNAAMAQLMAAVLGIIIFIDDYFNALTVGEVSRGPLTDIRFPGKNWRISLILPVHRYAPSAHSPAGVRISSPCLPLFCLGRLHR